MMIHPVTQENIRNISLFGHNILFFSIKKNEIPNSLTGIWDFIHL